MSEFQLILTRSILSQQARTIDTFNYFQIRHRSAVSSHSPVFDQKSSGKEEGEYIRFEAQKYSLDFCVAYNVTQASGNFRDDGLEPISLVIHATSHYMRDIEGQVSDLFAAMYF